MRDRRAVFILCLALCVGLGGCGSPDSAYSFDLGLEALSSLDTDAVRLSGFASHLVVPQDDSDIDTDGVDAEAFALFSIDDEELVSGHNIYERMYPASTTKILTALIALKYSDPEEIVTVPDLSQANVSGSSLAGLAKGDTISMRDLCYALMVPSGNDAAVAIATHISGSVDDFVSLMNEEARALGATHSHFVNPNGLPDSEHYTTVYDLYLIFNEAIKLDTFREIASTLDYEANINVYPGSVNPPATLSWTSGNAFLDGKFSFADGFDVVAGKTGHTNAAGFCLVLGSRDEAGDEYISIILDSYIYEELYASMRRLVAKAAG